ncbi:YqhR family membrane protein [Virgibacillus sp. C22-A2]|uniref:YqhR family membrane protein n=1 Tax=Virgibacillus tibetensis TaxID=3042313 RepID=A0ABU6KAC4_9BACI|nr:YqhR family membrane protein [Virgibacillus sp. C22-A2]
MKQNKHNKQLEQNNSEVPMSLLSRALLTGLIGGILWSIFGIVMYYFNFSEVSPKSFILRSWTTADWTNSWLGNTVTIVLVGILSILVAFIYYGLLKKINSMWVGAAFGVVLWGVIFYVLQPIFENVPLLTDLNNNTIVSTICLFILYGTFIGYSISYDYHDTKIKEQQQTEVEN